MLALLEQFAHNNFLVTSDNWFFAPNGKQYRGAWGKVKVYDSLATLGVRTNAKSTNWYAVIGEEGKSVIIAGCQIHYACVSMEPPQAGPIMEDRWSETDKKYIPTERESTIYIAQ